MRRKVKVHEGASNWSRGGSWAERESKYFRESRE